MTYVTHMAYRPYVTYIPYMTYVSYITHVPYMTYITGVGCKNTRFIKSQF